MLLTFALAFILCFLLSDKAAAFAYEMETTMQAFEPFVWTFGDANSVLLVSLLLIPAVCRHAVPRARGCRIT